MTAITEAPVFSPEITRFDTNTLLLGGGDGAPLNIPLKQLADRTQFLSDAIDALPGGSVTQDTFAWGDASPATVVLAPAGRVILSATLVIVEGFDGVGASLTLGDAADPDRFITAAQNDPATPGVYETTPIYTYGSPTNVLLTITPGSGATRGSGLVQLEFAQ